MKILIVDDEVEILRMLKRHLELDGFSVDICEDSNKAVDMMRSELYNIVLSDIRMPGKQGLELLVELKAINPLVNIIIMTGYSNMRYVVEALGKGAIDYFTKPFTHIEALLETLQHTRKKLERWQTAIKK